MQPTSGTNRQPFARLLPALLLGMAAVVFAVRVWQFWPLTVDDAYITFRYARNLAGGYGLAFNPGQPPVEGFTSILWVIVTAIPHLMRVDVVIVSKVLGVAFAVGGGYVLVRFVMLLGGQRRAVGAGAAALLYASFCPVGLHAVSGMETALAVLLMTAFLYLLTQFVVQPGSANPVRLALVALLLGLTRPEANLAAGLGMLAALALAGPPVRRRLAAALGAYVVAGAAYYVWRTMYFGLLLPLPFYLKVSGSGLLGWPHVSLFLLYLMIAVGGLAAVGLIRGGRALLPALAAVLSQLVFFLFVDHEVMGYAWRFLLPVSGFFFVLAGVGVAALLEWDSARQRRVKVFALLALYGLGLAFLLTWTLGNVEWARAYAAGLARAHVALGERLAAAGGDAADPVLAIGDAGAVPYLSGWRTVDTYGLNDPTIAREGFDAAYVLAQQPDVIVFISTSEDTFEPSLAYEAGLYRQALDAGYTVLGRRYEFAPEYYLWVAVRAASPVAVDALDR